MHKLLAAIFSVARRRQPFVVRLFFPAAAVAARGAVLQRSFLTENEPHGIWFVYQRSLTSRPRVHGFRSRAQRAMSGGQWM